MKRELKREIENIYKVVLYLHCKAYPDEKGIETYDAKWVDKLCVQNCKAYPDEKGIETAASFETLAITSYCKAYPDEKGIETGNRSFRWSDGRYTLQSLSR